MQLDTMQSDLNQLKELIQNEGVTLDVNTLMGVSGNHSVSELFYQDYRAMFLLFFDYLCIFL